VSPGLHHFIALSSSQTETATTKTKKKEKKKMQNEAGPAQGNRRVQIPNIFGRQFNRMYESAIPSEKDCGVIHHSAANNIANLPWCSS
jgi:hypothetical protein